MIILLFLCVCMAVFALIMNTICILKHAHGRPHEPKFIIREVLLTLLASVFIVFLLFETWIF